MKIGHDKTENQNSSNYDPNPLLNSLLCDVQFPDGTMKQYAANVIAENIHAQVANDGQTNLILDEIIDWDKNRMRSQSVISMLRQIMGISD